LAEIILRVSQLCSMTFSILLKEQPDSIASQLSTIVH